MDRAFEPFEFQILCASVQADLQSFPMATDIAFPAPAAPSRRRFLTAAGAGALAALGAGAPNSVGAGAPLKVAGIYSVPVRQRWIGTIHKALMNSVVRGDIVYEYEDNVGDSEFEIVFRQYSEKDVDLVVGDSFSREQPVRFLANQYPGKSYLMGSAFKSDARFPNLAVFDNYIQDAAYLTGLIAAGLSKNGVLGIIGRYRFAGINRLINAFMDGASEVRSDARFLVEFIDEWHNLDKSRSLARVLIEGGADVIYADALGPAEIARDAGVPVIGTVSDLHPLAGEPIVTSAVWRFGPTLEIAFERLKAGNFSAADYGIYSHMAHGGCALAPITAFTERISEETMELVALREGQIRLNKFAAKIDENDPVARLQAERQDN